MPRTRQLVAIMFTDIQGYTALMQHDEEQALQSREKHRQVFNTVTEKHKGKVLQYYGDGTLSIFDSAIEAVLCGIELQLGFQNHPVIPVRIGIHTGDIIFSEEEIIGDGVNVASRIESLAVAGSILISDKVYDEIKNQGSIQTAPLKVFKLKNVDRPIAVYAIANAGLVVPQAEDIQGKTDPNAPAQTQKQKTNGFMSRKRVWFAFLIALILAVALILYLKFGAGSAQLNPIEKSIAVLPFVNMSGDPAQEYFSDGITEEIINGLAQIQNLKVSGRTSSFAFKGKEVKLSHIAEELNVNTILEGSVQKADNRIRITVQLINAADEYHIWSEHYDRELDDIFALQDDISAQVVKKMRITLADEGDHVPKRKPTDNMEAYELLLQGRYYREQGVEGLEKARNCLEKAIELDPGFAYAYGELAGTWFLLSVYKFVPPEEGFSKVFEFGKKGVELDPNLPKRHLGLAHYYFWVEWNWDAALAEYQKEMALGSPPDIFHPQYLAFIEGNFDAALTEARAIIASDPLNIELLRTLAELYSLAGRLEEARAVLNKILELNPAYSEAYRLTGVTYLYEGNFDEALNYFEKAAGISPGKGYTSTNIIIALAASGQKEEARRLFSELMESDASKLLYAFEIANIYFILGETDKVFEWLNKAYDKREFWLVSLNVDPGWDPLRPDPRWQQLMDKMKFPPRK
jgi:TolB-like protein/class 3 adenylate cyclase/Tfp pilus assembly protein PilF